MITNIINTIFISLGIALSGNNNANNFNIEQKHRTNAIQTINQNVNLYKTANFTFTRDMGNNIEWEYQVDKYVMGSTNGESNYKFFDLNVINNTIYDIKIIANGYFYSRVINAYLNITNYRPSNLKYTLNQSNYINSNYTYNYDSKYAIPINTDLTQVINVPLTVENCIKASTIWNDIQQYDNPIYIEDGTVYAPHDPTFRHEEPYSTSEISSNGFNTYQVAINSYINISTDQTLGFDDIQGEPTSINISGSYETIPTVQQEIVDVPGLMFTVLTLPFSFISQAFNLTIFPGTPFQLNFTNLFLTLISIFILIWIIKHIIK